MPELQIHGGPRQLFRRLEQADYCLNDQATGWKYVGLGAADWRWAGPIIEQLRQHRTAVRTIVEAREIFQRELSLLLEGDDLVDPGRLCDLAITGLLPCYAIDGETDAGAAGWKQVKVRSVYRAN